MQKIAKTNYAEICQMGNEIGVTQCDVTHLGRRKSSNSLDLEIMDEGTVGDLFRRFWRLFTLRLG